MVAAAVDDAFAGEEEEEASAEDVIGFVEVDEGLVDSTEEEAGTRRRDAEEGEEEEGARGCRRC